ncbi:hypothetical protein GcM3_183023 [Golovinomyces cichoracearum]|uniref:Uncharacterized protein n=1 Tax=Golovinomyces cichoracearum TaxID=62708 RepID=A0A420HL34_9PEZI|nr:hypothetical protein GcM3_183023 [Golovinomyces cichoracearum]
MGAQPLGFCYFSLLKIRYYAKFTDLAKINDAAAVQKHIFTQCYHEAWNDRLKACQTRSRLKAAGLPPYKSRKCTTNRSLTKSIPTPQTPGRKRPSFNPSTLSRKPSQMTVITQNLIAKEATNEIAVPAL